MSKEIINNFAYSKTGWQTFVNCRREHGLRRVDFWKGWERSAPEGKRISYLLSKMTSYDREAGSLVHQIIEEVLAGSILEVDSALWELRNRWGKSIGASRRREWLIYGPKKVPPFEEHYYETAGDEERMKAKALRALSKAETCIRNFFTISDFPTPDGKERGTLLERLRPAYQLQVEELDSFAIRPTDGPELKVWSKPDLAIQLFHDPWGVHGEIYDWKTGEPRPEDREQLLTYVLFAVRKWNFQPGKIRVVSVYLKDKQVIEDVPDAHELGRMAEEILERGNEMRAIHQNQPQIYPTVFRPEEWPRTEDPRQCQKCDFFHRCRGHLDRSNPTNAPGFEV